MLQNYNPSLMLHLHVFKDENKKKCEFFYPTGGVWLPLHTKQQVSGREAGEEQVTGWHVFRAQKIFPFCEEKRNEKKGKQNHHQSFQL